MYVAQHSAAPRVIAIPTGEPEKSTPTPPATTTTTPMNEIATPTARCGESVSTPIAAAITAVSTGADAMSSAESPTGVVWRPTVHRIW